MNNGANGNDGCTGSSKARAYSRGCFGYILLLTSLISAGILALQHVGQMPLFGCGPGWGCSDLAENSWGSSVFGWPVSLLGLAYFGALSLIWPAIGWRPGLPPWLKWMVRLGAAGSVLFLAAMFVVGKFCMYCCVVHFANFAFLAIVELSGSERRGPLLGPIMIGSLAAATVLALPLLGRIGGGVAEDNDQQLSKSIQRIVEHVRRNDHLPRDFENGGFTGRYQRGPRRAAIRLVVFGDYNCKACREIHETIGKLLSERKDLSYSHKHLPRGCFTCNGGVNTPRLIETAGRAARAAETAGLLNGNDGFWAVHDWLVRENGEFTDEQLIAALPDLGFDDESVFFETMNSGDVVQRVEADVKESISLAVFRTPTVFVNGVLLEGIGADDSIQQAVEAVAAVRPQPRSAEFDVPMPGTEGLFRIWASQTPVAVPEPNEGHPVLGEADAPIRIVFWVDYQSPAAKDLSRVLQDVVAGRDDGTSLVIRHLPAGGSENATLRHDESQVVTDSWNMAKAAAAAAELGGPDTGRTMHEWLCDHRDGFTIDAASAAAEDMGISRTAFVTAVESQGIRARIEADIAAATDAGVGFAPRVYVNGREVPDPHDRGLYGRIFAELAR